MPEAANAPVHLLFLGFPGDVELAPRDPRSKRRPNRKVGFSERNYNGLAPEVRGWARGEPRELVSQSTLNRDTGETVLVFDADGFKARVLADFGADSSAFAHLPAKERKHFGFRTIKDAATYKKVRANYEALVAEEAE